ncbi:MAG: cell division protein ZapE [SAR86 cluster bacterium]|uniref:Cell division protein ZapE n=1 Tax=SAR86 cluster bacterium TaxID=2030880 RepID=A0A2A5B0A6_9GAMM|nr:MAG: cell division protein ZapE [SAR86 cluster bacterium]
MNPQQRYDLDIQQNLITTDPAQQRIVLCLQELFDELQRQPDKNKFSMLRLRKLQRNLMGSGDADGYIRGLYLWGGVGRGKTYLMDLFYDCLPIKKKLRTHFHRFMQRVHGELVTLQGEKNPLELVADRIAKEAQVLCFDEFFVQDIGDAMILAVLLEALMKRNVVLVATSNIAPDQLYENGLQRDRFLPAIDLIKQHTRVVEIETGVDYRLRSLSQATLYHHPISEATEGLLLDSFYELAPDKSEVKKRVYVELLNRKLLSRYCADDVVWFEFEQLCEGPRSAFDYVELAKLYHAVLLSNVPVLDEDRNDSARRFISLVDELYDRRVKLIISAQAPIQSLYQGQKLNFEFERTRSRLLEMQSHEYLGYQHRA